MTEEYQRAQAYGFAAAQRELCLFLGKEQDKPASGSVAKDIVARLGDPDNVKRWLVRLYAHRLTLLARHGATIGQLVNPNSGRNWGTKEFEIG